MEKHEIDFVKELVIKITGLQSVMLETARAQVHEQPNVSELSSRLGDINDNIERLVEVTNKFAEAEEMKLHFDCISKITYYENATWYCYDPSHKELPDRRICLSVVKEVVCSCGKKRGSSWDIVEKLAEKARKILGI